MIARPPSRRRAPAETWALVALGAGLVAVFALLIHYGLRAWNHNLDEDIYRQAGVWTWHHLPGSLWDLHASDRGLQRIGGWILGGALVAFGAPDGFVVARVVGVVCFVSTAIPVWLWARAAGATRPWAAGAAFLSVAVPWAAVTATFMTELVAYPLSVWALYAIWRVSVRPTTTGLAVAGVAIAAAALGRSVMVLLAPVLVVTIVAVGARFGLRTAMRRGNWTWRQAAPWVLIGAAVLVVGAVVALDRGGTSSLAGRYDTYVGFKPDLAWLLTKRSLAKVVSGVGILPGIVALAYVGRSLWRPARPESFALAVLSVLTAAFVVYSAMRAGVDERYLMYLAPVLAVGAAVAISRGEVGPVAVLVAGALVIALFAVVTWQADQQAFGYFISAAEAFHARVLLLGVGSRLSFLPFGSGALLGIGIAAVTAAAAWALARRGRMGALVGAVLAAGVVVLQLAQTSYVDRKFTLEAAYGPRTAAGHSWIDRAVGGHQGVGFFVPRTGTDWDFADTWREAAFWNLTVDRMVMTPDAPAVPSHGQAVQRATVDAQTGRIVPAPGTMPIPDVLLEWLINPVAPLVGRPLATSTYLPMRVVRVDPPARVAWQVTGTDASAWTVAGQTARIRVFKDAPGGRCLGVTVLGPPFLEGRRRVRVGSVRGSVATDEHRELTGIRLHGGTAGHFADVTVTADGTTRFPAGQLRGVRVDGIRRMACR